jgi:signal transduction histidine kinase
LGLGIVKNIIKSHNGTITFVSTPNKGTTFTIVLPKMKE